jgi:para-nitrobenzyl esterase
VVALTLSLPIAHAAPGQVVTTNSGPVSGTVTSTDREFLGIPYAAPPVGTLRWKAPQSASSWTAPRSATAFGSTCPQISSPFGTASTNEDCLYVNVYTPPVGPLGGALRHDPVMVWIHPGAFQFGEGSGFNPRQLVSRNVVVVTFNYRLGVLGFLPHPALTAEGGGTSGNYGFQDQQAALRWVHDNIAQFGGDPSNVTIFGQSAGGLSVHAHMTAPASAGLFHKAIIQSGGFTLSQPSLASSEPAGVTFAQAVGCSSQDLACMRAVPVSQVLANQDSSLTAYIPRPDGVVLPATIGAAFASGQFSHVPVIEGSVHDEFTLFIATLFTFKNIPVTADSYPGLIAALLQLPAAAAQVVVPQVLAQYPLSNYTSPSLALAAIGTDSVFACNMIAATQLLAQYTPTWSYEFDDPNAPQYLLPAAGFPYGAFHGSELPYLFDVRQSVPTPPLTADQQTLSNDMVLQWSRFARNGNPNTLQTELWPRFSPPLTQRVELLVPPQEQAYTATNFANDHKCAFWQALANGGS